jgi:hypothetical protein
MKKSLIFTTISLGLVIGAYNLGKSQTNTVEVVKEVPIEIIKEVQVEIVKEIKVPFERKITVPKIVKETITQKCEPQVIENLGRAKAIEDYVIATINSYPAEEAVMRIYDSIITPDWKK